MDESQVDREKAKKVESVRISLDFLVQEHSSCGRQVKVDNKLKNPPSRDKHRVSLPFQSSHQCGKSNPNLLTGEQIPAATWASDSKGSAKTISLKSSLYLHLTALLD